MKQLELSKNKTSLVDDVTFAWASRFHWYFHTNGYVSRRLGKNRVYLHRLIVHAQENETVDHINGNTLDNRIENLRICVHAENMRNQKLRKDSNSGYKGVGWHKYGKKWRARITVDAREISLGLFDSKEDAARAYDTAAIKYHGSFASLNFGKSLYLK